MTVMLPIRLFRFAGADKARADAAAHALLQRDLAGNLMLLREGRNRFQHWRGAAGENPRAGLFPRNMRCKPLFEQICHKPMKAERPIIRCDLHIGTGQCKITGQDAGICIPKAENRLGLPRQCLRDA